MKYVHNWQSYNESNKEVLTDANMLGKKVKSRGRSGMEYGLIVPTPSHIYSNDESIILWDTTKVDDYEEWTGNQFEDADDDYEFKNISSDGKPINRMKPRKGKNK